MSCCTNADVPSTAFLTQNTHQVVTDYYAALHSTKDLKTSACTAAAKPAKPIRDIIRRYI